MARLTGNNGNDLFEDDGKNPFTGDHGNDLFKIDDDFVAELIGVTNLPNSSIV